MRTIIAAALVAVAAPAAAHHGWSSYDEAKPLTVKGRLQQVTFGAPHGTAKVNWQKKTWNVVLAPVQRMQARGLALEEINKGQPVTLVGYARRDGTAEMRIERITVGNETVELR